MKISNTEEKSANTILMQPLINNQEKIKAFKTFFPEIPLSKLARDFSLIEAELEFKPECLDKYAEMILDMSLAQIERLYFEEPENFAGMYQIINAFRSHIFDLDKKVNPALIKLRLIRDHAAKN